MAKKSSTSNNSGRAATISSVKTYLGFFVLIVLVVEAVLGTLALKTEGQIQLVALYGMLTVIGTLIAVVSFFAYRKPGALLHSMASQESDQASALHDFGSRISGFWWERIKPDEPSALSFVEIHPDPASNGVKIKGSTYSKHGELAAFWESVATCINPGERKIFYYWKGWHPLRPNEPYEGFGEISFQQSANALETGVGFFSDTNLTDMKSTTKKSTEFRRCEDSDIKLMQAGERQAIADRVSSILS